MNRVIRAPLVKTIKKEEERLMKRKKHVTPHHILDLMRNSDREMMHILNLVIISSLFIYFNFLQFRYFLIMLNLNFSKWNKL